MVILYPQTIVSNALPSNPNACWDWWGYNNDPNTYDLQSGYQMNMVYLMIQRLTAAYISIPAPTGLQATSVTETQVVLTWNSVEGANGYNIQRNGVIINSALITSTTYTDTTIATGSTYSYAVSAVSDDSSSSFSTPISVVTPGPPPPLGAPQNLAVTSVTSSSVSLAWDVLSGAQGYNVYRDNSLINSAVVTATSYTDSGLQEETTYTYFVAGVQNSQEGPDSTTVSATTVSSYECTSYTDNNYAQVQAGRAYEKFGFCYAEGSNDSMGMFFLFLIIGYFLLC